MSKKHSLKFSPMWFLVIAVIVVFGGQFAYDKLFPPEPSLIQWQPDYTTAMKQADATGKPVFLLFTANWCPPCKKMKRHVWPNDQVEQLISDSFIAVKIDLTDRSQPQPIAQQFGVTSIPTLIVIDAQEIVLQRGSSMNAELAVQFLSQALLVHGMPKS